MSNKTLLIKIYESSINCNTKSYYSGDLRGQQLKLKTFQFQIQTALLWEFNQIVLGLILLQIKQLTLLLSHSFLKLCEVS